ncbi:MAG TPA: lytic transglycosylase domain-containing protein, partial [Cellvibrio sp.]|nr:lytic transglycosylase domain-containing protein [Cellvibrio sp.]
MRLTPVFTLSLLLAFAGGELLAETKEGKVAQPAGEVAQESSLADFEAQVRRVAERTAAEEKARVEQERLEYEAAAKKQEFKFFKYRKGGSIAYSDRQPHKTDFEVIVYNSCYACNPLSRIDWRGTRLHTTEFTYSISRNARKYGV